MATPFEKDFGYLMPFLDKIEGAAKALSDPRAREEAVSLAAGERERWARLRELLSGGAASQGPASDEPRQNGGPPPRVSPSNPQAPVARSPLFTVGRLKNDR